MKVKIIVLLTCLTAWATNSLAQTYIPKFRSDLPKCVGEKQNAWTLCVGTFKFPNGNIYTGEWHNGMREGNGELRIVAKGKSTENYIGSEVPAVYTGEFMNNKLNGRGRLVLDTGEVVEGDFVNNIFTKR